MQRLGELQGELDALKRSEALNLASTVMGLKEEYRSELLEVMPFPPSGGR